MGNLACTPSGTGTTSVEDCAARIAQRSGTEILLRCKAKISFLMDSNRNVAAYVSKTDANDRITKAKYDALSPRKKAKYDTQWFS